MSADNDNAPPNTANTPPKRVKVVASQLSETESWPRVDAFSLVDRVDVVMYLLQKGMPRPKIVSVVAKTWGCSCRQARQYIKKADEAYRACSARDRDAMREMGVRRMEDVIYAGAVKNNDWQIIEAQKVINSMLGLDAGTKIELSGALDGAPPESVVADLAPRLDALVRDFVNAAQAKGADVPTGLAPKAKL